MLVKLSAKDVISHLNGFLCVYKPRDVSVSALKKLIVQRICMHGNALIPPPVPEIKMPVIEPHPQSSAPVVVGLRKQMDYTMHHLVNGGQFNKMDFLLEEMEPMEATTSGVLLFAINSGVDQLEFVRDLCWVNEYRLRGKLGEASTENKLRGKIVARASSDHITQVMFKKFLTRLCFQYKRLSFELANVDMQSEEAFELARRGAARPKMVGSPVIYDLRLNHFKLPHFDLRMNVICENDYFLRHFVHEVGCSMGSLARPTSVQRTRVGPFLRGHALLDGHLQLPNILKNIYMCNRIIEAEGKVRKDVTINAMGADESVKFVDQFKLDFDRLYEERARAVTDGIEEEDDLRIPWGRDY